MLSQTTETTQFHQIMESVPFFEEEEKVVVGNAIVSTFNAAKAVLEQKPDLNYYQIFDKASNDLDIAAKFVKFSGDGDLQLTDQELILKVIFNLCISTLIKQFSNIFSFSELLITCL